MPFNKRRKERETALNERRMEAEDKLLAELETAADLKDPVKRILALKEVHGDIDRHLANEHVLMNKEATLSGTKTRFSTMMTSGTTGIVGALLLSTGPVGWALYGAGMVGVFGAGVAGDMGWKHKLKKMLKGASSHSEKMEVLKAAAMATIGETVENNVAAVSKSSSYATILEIPGISDKFAIAARQHIASSEEAPAVAKSQPPVKKIVLSPGK